jgi:predicted nucleic acid-binding protein
MSGAKPVPTRVVDASVVVEAMLGIGPHAGWAATQVADSHLAAPHVMPVEVANALRRAQARGLIGADVANLAHGELVALPVDLYPYEAIAERAWQMRASVASYDACYVALAELIGADLLTLDTRLSRAHGPTCRFLTPPG